MLVLSRHRNQQIVIGDEITVTVLSIRGETVRLGIDAPTRIPVHREEVWNALRKRAEEEAEKKAKEDEARDSDQATSSDPSDTS